MSVSRFLCKLKKFSRRIFVHALFALLSSLHSYLGILLRQCAYPSIFGEFGAHIRIAPLVEFVNPLGIYIEPDVKIAQGVRIQCLGAASKIVLHSQVVLDKGVDIKTHRSGRIKVGSNTYIGPFTCLSGDSILIGHDCLIAAHCSIYANNHQFADPHTLIRLQGHSYKGITIESNCWIGAGVTILDGVSIGKGSVVGAGSVVTKSIPSFSVAVGVPARVIKRRKRRNANAGAFRRSLTTA